MTNVSVIPKRLLIVEQDREKRDVLKTFFQKECECDTAASLEEAFELIRRFEYSVVVAPILIPEMRGLELIERIQRSSPKTVPIFTSEVDSAGHTVKAFRAGAFDVIHMPTSLHRLETAIERALIQFEMRSLRDRYRRHLEDEVAVRTAELERAFGEIESSYRMTLQAIVKALEQRELEAEGHSERMVTFSLRLGFEMGLDQEALRDLELGTLLHDVGKIAVSDHILKKPDTLSKAEWSAMKRHTIYGHDIIRNIPFLDGASRIVAQHHECWDGTGYPYGLRGEQIDVGARILSVIDAFDAMISDRVYRKGRGYREALAEIEKYSGTQFDPIVVDAFRQVPKEDWAFLRDRSLKERSESESFRAIVSQLVYSRREAELVH
jgi:response regulator RpfG family c-di-GMP phosphodiesterase